MPKNKLIKCTSCNGSGEDPNYPKTPYSTPCTDCNGSGTIESEIQLKQTAAYPQDKDSYYRKDRHDADYDEDI